MEDEIAEFVFDNLCKNFGHLYVCGDVQMAIDVGNTLKKIFMKEGNMTEEEAEKLIHEMKVIKYRIVYTLLSNFALYLPPYKHNVTDLK